MSCNVLIIPEDPTLNGYLLKPLAECVLAEAGRANAKIQILRDPKVEGFDSAKQLISEGTLMKRYGHYDLWLFIPDADRQIEFGELERKVAEHGRKACLFSCAIQPEIEACLIAGHPRADRKNWAHLRQHLKFKEEVFWPFLKRHGNPSAPGQGREKLMREALQQYAAIKQLCPELASLENRIRDHFK